MIVMAKFLFGFLLLLFSCKEQPRITAHALIQKTIAAHGWEQQKPAKISFNFRAHHYEILRENNQIVFARTLANDTLTVVDRLENFNTFTRTQNNFPVAVTDSMQKVYSASINSVMYFMQLPLGLRDAAVVPTYKGVTQINAEPYHQLAVTFKEPGGGEDFQDQFFYWIHQDHFQIDYMAYNYQTNGGGTRFRVAKNKQRIQGILFQDYDNYKPKKHPTPLDSLAYLWANNELQLLSRIENINIALLNN